MTFVVVLTVLASLLHSGSAEAAPGPIGEIYVQGKRSVPKHERRSVTVQCPDNRPVISGGTYVSGTSLELKVVGNLPVDGSDRDNKPDDAWKGTIRNGSSEGEEMQVRAQCGRRADRDLFTYITDVTPAPPGGSNTELIRVCPDGAPVGGGASISGGNQSASVGLLSSLPIDGADVGTLPDSWQAIAANRTGQTEKLTVRTVCATLPGTFTHADGTRTVGPQDQDQGSVSCPGGTVALGGGPGRTDGIPGVVDIATIRLDRESTGEAGGWTVWMNNYSVETRTYHVVTMCLTVV